MKPFLRPLVLATTLALAVPLLTAQSAAAAPADDLILRYVLDETSGTVAVDSSGKGRNGTLSGGAVASGTSGVKLDGVDDYVKLPDDVLAGLTSITVSAEVLVSTTQGTPYFIWGLGNTTSGAGNGYLYTTGNSYKASIATGNWTTEQTVNSGTNLARGVWKTLTYTLDDASDTARLYLDGTQVAQQTGVTITPGAIGGGKTTANAIGRSVYTADKTLSGSVRDFRIYSSALTASDVAGLQATDTTRVARDTAALDLGDLSSVTANLTLPTTGANGSAIAWSSSDTAVISTSGVVTRPASGVATATLTATVTRGSATQTRTFTAKVPAQDVNADAQKALDALRIVNAGDVRGNVTLPAKAGAYDVSWTSSNTAVIDATGVVKRQAASTPVTLTATVAGTTATRQIPVTVTAAPAGLDTDYDAGYLWTHFAATDYEKIYFGSSTDGLHWSKLNGNKAVLANLAGTLGVRDPHLVRSPTGDEYWILGTDLHAEGTAAGGSWDQVNASQKLVVWRSTDLVNWSDQSLVFAGSPNAGNVWAPEAMWDETTGQYYVYWSGRDKTQAGTDDWALRVYVSTTRDFTTFSTPTVWLDENSPTNNADGPNIIDTTIAKENGVYYRFSTSDWRTVVDTAPSLAGPWKRVIARGEDTAHGLSNHIEGLTVYQLPDGRWVVMGDSGGYSAFVTDSLASLQFTALTTGATGANTYSFAAPFRHGSVLRLSSAEEARITAAYGTATGPTPKPVNAAGEILRYSFDGGSGTTVQDVTGHGLTGTLVSGAAWQTGSVKLDGTDDYIDLPDNLLTGVTDITVQADVWIDSAQSGAYFIYGLGNTTAGAGDGYLFTSGNNYRTSLATGNWTTEQTVSSGSALPRGTWAHLTYTLAGTTATVYLDGVKVGTGTVTADPKDIGGGTTTANAIGRSNYDADNRFRGQIREFAIYNRALSSAEVLASSGNTTVLADATLTGDVLKTAPIVDQANRVITFPVKPGTDRTKLTPTYSTAAGVTASPASGTVRDLSTPKTVVLTPVGGGASTTWTLKAVEMKSPVIPGLYADPNIAVFGDTYYIYATTDGTPGWGGKDFYVWSSKNLVDWTRSATPFLTLDGANGNVPWATGNAWAPTIIEKGGKYYFYFGPQRGTQPQDDRSRGRGQPDGPVHRAAVPDDHQRRVGELGSGDRPGRLHRPGHRQELPLLGQRLAGLRRAVRRHALGQGGHHQADQRSHRLPRGRLRQLPPGPVPPDLLDRRHRQRELPGRLRDLDEHRRTVDLPRRDPREGRLARDPRHRPQLDHQRPRHRRLVHRLPPLRDPRRERDQPRDHRRQDRLRPGDGADAEGRPHPRERRPAEGPDGRTRDRGDRLREHPLHLGQGRPLGPRDEPERLPREGRHRIDLRLEDDRRGRRGQVGHPLLHHPRGEHPGRSGERERDRVRRGQAGHRRRHRPLPAASCG
ncbi:family 43 glycosylhydrolase [Rathayibacter oskolensis]|nr:LamG-like jellyroll fold domain-containing protein [Rathayibacter oskolensis]WKK72550.1 family 43 glycosylhydrolase [Rathayibacter oskolensis]